MILYIDDEPRYIKSFVDDLTIEFDEEKIELYNNTDKAINFFNNHSQQINIVILDIMMPSGRTFKDKPTKEGLLTGLFIYEYIRENNCDLPIIIFTNTPENYIFDIAEDNTNETKKIIHDLKKDIDSKKALFLLKENLFPYEFTDNVKSMLKKQ